MKIVENCVEGWAKFHRAHHMDSVHKNCTRLSMLWQEKRHGKLSPCVGMWGKILLYGGNLQTQAHLGSVRKQAGVAGGHRRCSKAFPLFHRCMGSAPRQVGAAKTVVNKAYDDGLVSAETVQVFKRVKKLLKRNSNARDTVLTIEQIESLMGALPHHTKTIMATAFYTGMRRGEILSLTWDKVNLEKKVIRLEAGDTKDREPRTIPISKELFPILAAIPRALHDNHVFLYKGKPVRDIRTGLIVACKTAGIPYGRFTKNGFVFHDLRHTFNTYMRKAGVAESVIMEITGHSTREMFDRYNTIDHDDRRQAVDQMSTFLTNLDQFSERQGGK